MAIRLSSRWRHVILFSLVALLLLAPGVRAQQHHPLGWGMAAVTGPLSADRPGFSTSPQTVARGHLQLEGGYQFTYDNEGPNTFDHTLPLALFRVGLLDFLEFRVSWAGLSWTEVGDETGHDLNDMSIEFKVKVYEAHALALGLLGALSLPVGTGDATSDEADPSLGVLWTYTLTAEAGVFGTILFSSLTEENDKSVFETATAAGASFAITPRLGSYVEYFGLFRDNREPAHNLNGGVTYLLGDNLQVDINAGSGLSEPADDFFIGTGVVWRW